MQNTSCAVASCLDGFLLLGTERSGTRGCATLLRIHLANWPRFYPGCPGLVESQQTGFTFCFSLPTKSTNLKSALRNRFWMSLTQLGRVALNSSVWIFWAPPALRMVSTSSTKPMLSISSHSSNTRNLHVVLFRILNVFCRSPGTTAAVACGSFQSTAIELRRCYAKTNHSIVQYPDCNFPLAWETTTSRLWHKMEHFVISLLLHLSELNTHCGKSTLRSTSWSNVGG